MKYNNKKDIKETKSTYNSKDIKGIKSTRTVRNTLAAKVAKLAKEPKEAKVIKNMTPSVSATVSASDDNNEPTRIAKVIARSGVCSRRDAEKLVLAGKVKVNDKVITSPALNVTDDDKIMVEDKPLAPAGKVRVWRYHKPAGLITTHQDTKGRDTVFQKLPKNLPRVISVGRLDLNSEGLLLLTNDGEVARFMESPKTAWRRRYKIRVHGKVTNFILEQLTKGITYQGVNYGKADVVLEKQQGTNAWLEVAINEGKNREVRKMCEAVGLAVNKLIRLSYGPFQLGNLKRGEVEEVTGKVIKELLGNYKAKK